ncbi:iron-sulfur cluster assembly protein [Streptomyces chiangmaiensis]|uniref:Iron-sulfur cluster assembly protein n=1 Tax=Streptomyces chiangmaiensis TaxID=766497 RepID=A0ABU7FQ24_9ACTN|nr:iron-sulfur cluster assembly protein [Streptomyces chiangmaiensis]MED7825543.1 iron-sulfur cluster assembly protein [Streptomyces chiangmaiensis]
MTTGITESIPVTEAADRSEAVTAALATVLDPELDRPITELGFVRSVGIDAGHVQARLRLPTYFCAPNFAWLMVEDARRALAALPWATEVTVVLEDHFASDEINHGVACGQEFAEAFPLLADPDRLEELRRTFLRKGYLAVQERLGRRLTDQGWTARQMAEARVADLPGRLITTLVRRRRALGLPADGVDPLFTDEHGRALLPVDLEAHLRRCRTIAVGISANTEMCEGLLATRYGPNTAGGTA